MGHLGHLKEEYGELVDRLSHGSVGLPEPEDPKAWEGWKEILELLYTPEEAALAARLPVRPTSLKRLSKLLDIPERELQARFEPMCDKGVVMDLVNPKTGEAKYFLSPPVVGFFEYSMMRANDSIPKKRMAEALEAYTHGNDEFVQEVFGHGTTIGRAVVHETALADDPVPDVLDFERASTLVEQARTHAVSLCYCRHKAEHLGKSCDAPLDNCLSLNAGAEFVIRRGFGRRVEKAEALRILEQARAQGLVQLADNVQKQPTYLCNCCGCCCGQLQSINEFGLRGVNPSGFLPGCEDQTCKGCSRCSRACPVAAIDMVGRRVTGQRKNQLRPQIEEERCIGCGVCADACHNGALKMRRHAHPRVPASSVEKAVRMALERGRLADLVFDEAQSPRLNSLLRAITTLPFAQRLLAAEQLQSRFVRFALGQVKL